MAVAMAAQTATASAAGLTAFTCVEGLPAVFNTDHCVPGETSSPAFRHVAITEETHARLSNAKTNVATSGPTNMIFKETIAGVNLELEAQGTIEGLGTLKNEEVGGVMQASAESASIVLDPVIVKAPAEKGCNVFSDDFDLTKKEFVEGLKNVIFTEPLKGHTTVVTDKENGEGTAEERHSVIIEPVEGTVFATFWIDCTGNVPPALQGTWAVIGKITCPTHGATFSCNHTTITEANTLRGKGTKAGLQGKATATAGKFPTTEPTNPVSVTTTTP